jgi:hypothetical protein
MTVLSREEETFTVCLGRAACASLLQAIMQMYGRFRIGEVDRHDARADAVIAREFGRKRVEHRAATGDEHQPVAIAREELSERAPEAGRSARDENGRPILRSQRLVPFSRPTSTTWKPLPRT